LNYNNQRFFFKSDKVITGKHNKIIMSHVSPTLRWMHLVHWCLTLS